MVLVIVENNYQKYKKLTQEQLIIKLNRISNEIVESQRNGVGNYMIVGSEFVNALENLDNQKLRRKKIKRLLKQIKN